MSLVFLSEVLRERIAQTASTNNVLLHSVLASTQTALQEGMAQNPPENSSEAAFEQAVVQALRSGGELTDILDGFVRYSQDMEDAVISGADGRVLVSSNPALLDRPVPSRRSFTSASEPSLTNWKHLLFGQPETLDISLPLNRNGEPFLVAHLGVRSTFLRNTYSPWLRTAALVCFAALAGSLLVAAALSAVALRPLERIGHELEVLSRRDTVEAATTPQGDAVQRVSSTISRLDAQMRTSEQTRSEIASNLNSMLAALKDGVILLTADQKIATASDAVANFLLGTPPPVAGTPLANVFPAGTSLGDLLPKLLRESRSVHDHPLTLEDGRTIELSVNAGPGNGMGALITLHDVAAQEELEQELQVARRLASIGRLTAGVGHEVKNPINAMVVHLELLRGKLTAAANAEGAQRHVEVLASEMSRLDRVVQTLADFSRPLEPILKEEDLLPIVQAVVRLIAAEAGSHDIAVTVLSESREAPVRVLCDAELLRQALLNIALNAMQAMPDGGALEFRLTRERQVATISIRDTGDGISPEALNRIFDLYYTTKKTGSGIGLAMTYRIVQLHGGGIQVQSETSREAPERGTTFTLRLPLVHRNAAATQAATA
ncbi:MAG: sensor histidine kinase [Janthinobacterium lividum]